MICPTCGHTVSKIVSTKPWGNALQRRRVCDNCNKPFKTSEKVIKHRWISRGDGQ